MMRKMGLSIGIIIILLIAGSIYHYYSLQQNTALPATRSVAKAVQVTTVQQQTIPHQLTALGSLIAYNNVQIAPEIAGKVNHIDFHSGQWVKHGQVLLTLDDQIQKTQLLSAKANFNLSKTKYLRAKLLAARGAESQQNLDNAKAQYLIQQSLVDTDRVLLAKMTLKAPFSGNMSAPLVSNGQYVKVGQNLVTIVDRKHLRVQYSVPENNLNQLHIGQLVTLSSRAYPGKQFQAKVIYVSPLVDPATRTITVRAKVNNKKGLLSPGLFVRVRQNLGDVKHALVIPQEAIVNSLAGAYVFKVTKHHVTQVAIKLGAVDGNKVEVTAGLSLGDVIVSAGQQRLKNGDKVTFKPSVA